MNISVQCKKGEEIVSESRDVSEKKLYIFDVDNTLTESKSVISQEIVSVLQRLLEVRSVALISGGGYEQLQKQCANYITDHGKRTFPHTFLLAPTSGSSVYSYVDHDWKSLHAEPPFTDADKVRINQSIDTAMEAENYTHPEHIYGDVIEDRGTQITFSAVGQQAPVDIKKAWNKQYSEVRIRLRQRIQEMLPDIRVGIGGSTSIDITRSDKGDGVHVIMGLVNLQTEDLLFFGDQLQAGGNDYAIFKTGIDAIHVSDPEETKTILTTILTDSANTV